MKRARKDNRSYVACNGGYPPQLCHSVKCQDATPITNASRFVTAPHEEMVYVAQSPTKTVGADARTAGSIDGSVDLSAYGFDDVHSAEYQFTTQQTKPFSNWLLEEFDLPFIP